MSDDKIVLGYWKIRGLAQPIRYALELVGADYREDLYEVTPAPEFDRSQWTDKKFKLGLDFPNLPYLFDGDVKLTQSTTILRYLARKFDLGPASEEEERRVDLLMDELTDLRRRISHAAYASEELYPERLEGLQAALKDKLPEFEAFIGEWAASGPKPTIADCVLYEVGSQLRLMTPKSLEGFPKIAAFMERFEALAPITAYHASDRYRARPVNNLHATFK